MKKDYTGQKIHRLTFIRPTEKKLRRNILWEAICECGKTVIVIPKRAMSCGCFAKEVSTLNGKSSRRYDPIVSSARIVWQRSYMDGDVDFDTFYRLSQLPCDYCNRSPSTTYNMSRKISKYQILGGDFTYNGLDRVDNARGHMKDNVVPCCWPCNNIKGNSTREEFISHIEAMYAGTRKYRQ